MPRSTSTVGVTVAGTRSTSSASVTVATATATRSTSTVAVTVAAPTAAGLYRRTGLTSTVKPTLWRRTGSNTAVNLGG